MISVLRRLWDDDQGVIEAIEFLLTAAIVAFGLVVGLTCLRNALTAEFQELANAINPNQMVAPAVCTPAIPVVSPVTFPCP